MTPVIINAIQVGIAVWLGAEFFHLSGLGLVFASVVIYVVIRVAFGLAMMALGAALGRRDTNNLTWS
jgi:hypothetical protein